MNTIKNENFSLISESHNFRESLRNDPLIRNGSLDNTKWAYKNQWYYSKSDLYVAILANETAEQFGIQDIVALIAVLSGQAILPTRKKFSGATKGTSVASKYLSKIPGKSPIGLPMITGNPKIIGGNGMKVAYTKIIGRFLGRATPIVGWGIMAYDISIILYDTQIEFNKIIDEE